MKDDNGPGDQILFNQPPDVPHRRVDGVMRIRGAKDALVPVRSGKPELLGPRYTTGRAEELQSCCDADCFLGLLEVTEEVGIRVVQSRTVHEVVVAYLVSGNFDTGNQLRVAEGPLANEKEGCFGVVLLENLEDLGRKGRVRAIIEGKGNQGTVGPNSISDVWRESLEYTQDGEWLYPEHQEPHPEEDNDRQEYRHDVSAPSRAILGAITFSVIESQPVSK